MAFNTPMAPNVAATQFDASSPSDHELVALAAAGHAAAFEAIMRKNNRLLFRTARAIVKNDSEAEDVVQEAYLQAWRALAKFRVESKISTWLVRITVNEALGRLRRTHLNVIPLAIAMKDPSVSHSESLSERTELEPENNAIQDQMRALIEKHIDALPDAFRVVFILRAIEELSVEEVAQSLDIPEATVRTRYFRARSLLRESIARHTDTALANAFGFDGLRCDRLVEGVLTRAADEGLIAPARE